MYVGQSTEINTRWIKHRYQLRHNIHKNTHLQNSFNKYGENNFEFVILQECEEKQLNKLEQSTIDDNPDCYNMVKYVEDVRGKKNPFFGKKHRESSKLLMSKWKKKNFLGINNPNYGNKQTKETVIKMALNNSHTKLSVDDVKQIADMLKENSTHQEIADKFNVSRTVITRISNGTRWANVTGGPIVPVIYENGKRVFSELHKDRIGKGRKGHKHSEEAKQLMREKALSQRG